MRKDDHRGICYYEVGLSLSLFVVLTKNSILDLRNFSQQKFVNLVCYHETCRFLGLAFF